MELEVMDENGNPLDYGELVKECELKIVEKDINKIITERMNSPLGTRQSPEASPKQKSQKNLMKDLLNMKK